MFITCCWSVFNSWTAISFHLDATFNTTWSCKSFNEGRSFPIVSRACNCTVIIIKFTDYAHARWYRVAFFCHLKIASRDCIGCPQYYSYRFSQFHEFRQWLYAYRLTYRFRLHSWSHFEIICPAYLLAGSSHASDGPPGQNQFPQTKCGCHLIWDSPPDQARLP